MLSEPPRSIKALHCSRKTQEEAPGGQGRTERREPGRGKPRQAATGRGRAGPRGSRGKGSLVSTLREPAAAPARARGADPCRPSGQGHPV